MTRLLDVTEWAEAEGVGFGVAPTEKGLEWIARVETGRFEASWLCPGDWWVRYQRGRILWVRGLVARRLDGCRLP